uniref:Neutral cholesterol ester hydrolase 1 n=1 Tax=Cyclopterus lumpus TaxID=8103 RepID=A0A8C3FX32_CYCLU
LYWILLRTSKQLHFPSATTLPAAYYVYLPLPSGVSEPWKLMLLDALIRSFMQAVRAAGGQVEQDRWSRTGGAGQVEEDSDSSLGGVPARVFLPTAGRRLKRGVVYFHGGGWALGSALPLQRSDVVFLSRCRSYRLAPEAVFPDQYHDALAASRAFLSAPVLQRYGIDPERVCVSGDSAGGNLAAAVAQEWRSGDTTNYLNCCLCPQLSSDDTLPVKFKVQALIYPVLQALDFYTPSYQQNRAVPILYRPVMARFWLQYLGADASLEPLLLANNHSSLDQPAIGADARSKLDWTALLPAERKKHFRPVARETGSPQVMVAVPELMDVRAAPLLAELGALGATPKAYVMTCEFDVLRDDGLMYIRRLRDAGVAVTSDHYEDGFHGCMAFAFAPVLSSVGRRSADNYIRWLDQNL